MSRPSAAPSPLAQVVTEAVRRVTGGPAALHEPEIAGKEWTYVKDCLDTGWVSSVGTYVNRFEAMLADVTGSPFAIATASGTAALHVALLLAGVQPGDEVIVPSLTFVATANAVSYCGAYPHFADCEETTLGLDARRLDAHLRDITDIASGVCVNRRTGRIIRALVCMHAFGHPCDIDGLSRVAERFSLVFIEDAAESLGSLYKGRHTGTFGRIAALSFNGNKIVTTGGGGAVLTADPDFARRAKHLTTTAKAPHRWEFFHDEVGYNYRLPNISAAIGCAQLERLPELVAAKRRLADRYAEAFAEFNGVRMAREPDDSRSNYWLNILLLDRQLASERDDILDVANNEGLIMRPAWRPMHVLPMYLDCPRMALPATDDICRRALCLPSSARLGVGSGR
jgi:perosamine synthetase